MHKVCGGKFPPHTYIRVHRELCRVRDEQKTFGKIKVKTEFNL